MSSTSSYTTVDKGTLIKTRLINGHQAAVLFWRVLKFHQAYIDNFDTNSVVDRDDYMKGDQFPSLRYHDKMAMMQLQESQLLPVKPDRSILDDTEPFDSGTCRVHRTVLVDGTPVTDFLPFATWDWDAPWIKRDGCFCRRGVGVGGARFTPREAPTRRVRRAESSSPKTTAACARRTALEGLVVAVEPIAYPIPVTKLACDTVGVFDGVGTVWPRVGAVVATGVKLRGSGSSV